MEVLVVISTLFVIGSIIGYVIELFYRRFVSQKRWVNPGFLVGPYIPLYGFGVILLFAISNFGIANIELPETLKTIIILAIIGIMMTLIELVAGLIFIKGMHLKLWDYSDRWGNFKGVICPLFSLIWFVAGSLYYFFLNPLLVNAIEMISTYPIYDYFVGLVIGMMVVDFAYSLHLGFKLKKISNNLIIKFEQFKLSEMASDKESGNKPTFFFHKVLNEEKLKKIIEDYKTHDLPLKKWWKKHKDKKDTN